MSMRRNYEVAVNLGQGVRGFIVIDSILNNTSSGGVRIAPDISLSEVRKLARAMTLKYGFLGFERGGAKCGLAIPDGIVREERIKVLELFGSKIASLIHRGIYYPGMDMNCGPEELRAVYRGAGITLGELTDTSYFTALSLAKVIAACRNMVQPDKGRRLTIAVEGFGNVAMHLAHRLPEELYRIVAVSTISGARRVPGGLTKVDLALRDKMGDDFVHRLGGDQIQPKEDLLSLKVDFLIPSARIFCINQDNVDRIQARYVVPAANAPYAGDCHRRLFERGVIGLPGFVCNSGGIFASSLYDSGVSMDRIELVADELFQPMVEALLAASVRTEMSPVDIAAGIAMQHVKAALELLPHSLFSKALFKAERTIMPHWMRQQRVRTRFERGLVNLRSELNHFQAGRGTA